MKGRLPVIVLVLLAVALAGWGGWWFYNNFERASKLERSGLSPEARKNPLLAAEMFISRLGVESESVSGRERLLKLPQEPGLLLISHLGPSLSPEREDALIHWVELGGHLVITPETEGGEESERSTNTLLERLGVELLTFDLIESEDDEDLQLLTSFEYPGLSEAIKVAFDPDRVVFDFGERAIWGVESEEGYHLLQYAIGQGRVTVLSDNDIFTNNRISEEDHGLLLWLLAEDQDRAWLLYSSNMPSLLKLLWVNAPQLLVAALLLLIISVWHLGLRSGPRLALVDLSRRNLLEHLLASSAFSWRTDRAKKMMAASRQAVEQEWQRRHPVLQRMEPKARCEWIAEQTGLAPRAVESALYDDYSGEQDFIKISSVLQKLAVKR